MTNDKLMEMLNQLVSLRKSMDSNNIKSLSENEMLYTLAFISLIRNGMDFSIINKIIGEKEEKKRFVSFGNAKKEKEILTKDYIEIKSVMGDFSCSAEKVKALMSEKDYNVLILKIRDDAAAPAKNFKLAEYDESYGVVKEETKVVHEDQEEEIEEINNISSRLPQFYEDKSLEPDFPGKKLLSTMFYHIHALDIIAKGAALKAIFTIYPIKITADEPATDIAVSAVLYDPLEHTYSVPRGGVSRGASATVNIEFDDMVFAVYGSWEHGKFQSFVRNTKKGVEIKDDKLTEHVTGKNKTSTTYTIIRDDELSEGVNAYIFPAIIGENSSTGYIVGVLAVENKGEKSLTIVYPNSEGEFLVTADKNSYLVGSYWQGTTLDNMTLVYSIEQN